MSNAFQSCRNTAQLAAKRVRIVPKTSSRVPIVTKVYPSNWKFGRCAVCVVSPGDSQPARSGSDGDSDNWESEAEGDGPRCAGEEKASAAGDIKSARSL